MNHLRLAIVDDSSFIRKAIQRLLENEARIQVVGAASSGEELLENLHRWRPDVVTLDLQMPGMGGFQTLDQLRAWKPIPVIILSTHSAREAPMTIEALHRGAVDFIDKQQYSLVDFQALREVLVEKILLFGGASIAQAGGRAASEAIKAENEPKLRRDTRIVHGDACDAVFIGASTGGPPAVQEILEGFRHKPSVPLAVVQHMPIGFTRAFAERLNAHLPMAVKEAGHAEPFERGVVHIAPSGHHLRIKREGARLFTVLTRYPENTQHRPSVDVLFQSAVQALGARSIGVLLTGMGKDGAQGLLEMHHAGARTIAQSERSCIVYGMPKAAVDIGAVQETLDLKQIGPRLESALSE